MAAARRRKSSRSPSASAASPKRSPSRRRAARAVVAPLGQSIVWQMLEHDPTPKGLQAVYVVLTVSGLLAMSRLPTLLLGAIPSLGGCGQASSAAEYTCSSGWQGKAYDSVVGVSDATVAEPRAAIMLLQSATGLTVEELWLAATNTAIAFTLLATADLLSSIFPQTIAWPKSWNTDNCQCYTEMFGEPTRESLIRRPGNVYSNCLYWFGGLTVLMSCLKEQKPEPNVFWLADSMFGFMLMVLAVLSVVWHSSNAPTAQYIDLWSMDSCIVYLIVRITCIGAVSALRAASIARHTAEDVSAWCCAVLFFCLVCTNALYWRANYRARWLHGGCPFAGRTRLQAQIDGRISAYHKSSGYLHDSGGAEMHTFGAALYAGMPIIYMALPTLIQTAVIGSLGSIVASTVAATSLSMGWSLRMFERFCMDGSPRQNKLPSPPPPIWSFTYVKHAVTAAVLTTGAALFSPTAHLHVLTGITLIAGYVHARASHVHTVVFLCQRSVCWVFRVLRSASRARPSGSLDAEVSARVYA